MNLDLAEIKALCDATTPGPWKRGTGSRYIYHPGSAAGVYMAKLYEHQPEADAEFIARSRALVPALVAEVERLRAENEEQRLELLAELGNQDGGLPEWMSEDNWWVRTVPEFGALCVLPMGSRGRDGWAWLLQRNRLAGNPAVNGQALTARKAMRAAEAWLAEQAAKVTT